MPALQISLLKGDKVGSNVDYRDNLPTNVYVSPRQFLGNQGNIMSWYGLTYFATAKGVDRGGIWVSREGLEGHYRVSGDRFIRVDANGLITYLGEITGTGYCRIDYTFNNVFVVGDGKLWYYNKAVGLRQITDPDVGNPIDGIFVDGYVYLTDGENIYHSTLADEEVFETIDYSNAETSPDPSMGLGRNESNEVVVFGKFSTEYFVNVGKSAFAFQRIQRKAQKIGILGTHAKAEMYGNWYTLARRKETSPSVHIFGLGSDQKIATREVEKLLKEYTEEELESAVINCYEIDKVKFVQINLIKHTLIFNATIAEAAGVDHAWSILKTDILGDANYRAQTPVFDPRISKWIVGDKRNGTIGYLDETTCTHYSEKVEWLLYTPFIKMDGASVDKIEIETISGEAPEEDATVALSMTYDGRFHGKEVWMNYGANLDYSQRFELYRLGYVRNWCGFKLRGVTASRMSFGGLTVIAS